MSDASAVPRRAYLPPPVWGLLMLPFGLAVGFATLAVPFALRARGVPMMAIATVTQAAALPHVIKPFWSPLLDSGPRRRTWFFVSIACTAVALAVTALIPAVPGERVGPAPMLVVYTAALFVSQAAAATSGSAVLALMALTVPDAKRGAASGWQTAGNLAGTAAGGALLTWMLARFSPAATGLVVAAICGIASLPALLIDEVPPSRRSPAALLRELLRDVWRTLKSREGWTGMVFCLSPVGAGALTNLFSALAKDYAPDDAGAERLVVLVAGLFGSLANTAGALLGGLLADRMNRRLAYAICGALSGVCALAMIAAPATPLAFTAGCLAYLVANGLCYAVFYAFVLELVARPAAPGDPRSAGTVTTQLALYIGASNLAASYVTWFDGWGYDRAKGWFPGWSSAGRAGMLGMDALTTFVGLAVLGGMTLYVRRGPGKRGPVS